jgi:hypothetical protein
MPLLRGHVRPSGLFENTHPNEWDQTDAGGRAVQVDPMKPGWTLHGTQHFKVKCDILLSTFALKFNLRRHRAVTTTAGCRAFGMPGSIFLGLIKVP